MSLIEHAQRELALAGLLDKDSDYDGMLGKAALEIVEVFANQGHSGASAAMVTDLVQRLMRYEPLTPIGTTEDEWMFVAEDQGGPIYQNRRCSSAFSRDGGKTWYDIDDPTACNGDSWGHGCPTDVEGQPKTHYGHDWDARDDNGVELPGATCVSCGAVNE